MHLWPPAASVSYTVVKLASCTWNPHVHASVYGNRHTPKVAPGAEPSDQHALMSAHQQVVWCMPWQTCSQQQCMPTCARLKSFAGLWACTLTGFWP